MLTLAALVSGEWDARPVRCHTEGATAPEPLRPKDRRETHTLERMCLHITDGESDLLAKLSGSQTAGAVHRF